MPMQSPPKSMHHVFMAARDTIAKMLSRLVPPKEIEDIVQETYVKICQLDNYAQIEQPTSFLFTTARNLAYDHLKKAETRLADSAESELCFHSDGALELHDSTFQHAASKEEFGYFCEAVRNLPLQCRRVFVLKKVYGYTQKEIANEMKISESAVEKHIATGIKRCTKYMLSIDTPIPQGSFTSTATKLDRMETNR